jgi:hypothetical protein
LQAAGVFRRHVRITNYLKRQPNAKNDISPWFHVTDKKRHFTTQGWDSVLELREELNSLPANIFVALGGTALAALTYRHPTDMGRPISKIRGYFLEAWNGRKMLATLHPANAIYGSYMARYLISWDLKKAAGYSETPELVRPEYRVRTQFSFPELLGILDEIEKQPILAFDIEVNNFEVECLSFAWSPLDAISIAFDHRWYVHEEATIWRRICAILENPRIKKIAQNAIFDCYFLAMKTGIFVSGLDPSHSRELEDTMIRHHCAYPEMRKSLEFLISVYGGTAPYHKDMVKFNNIKEDA